MKLGLREKYMALAAVLVMAVIAIVVGLVLGFVPIGEWPSVPPLSTTTASPPNPGYDSAYKRYPSAAVTTDTNICSQIGV